jgi:hypothetical protein
MLAAMGDYMGLAAVIGGQQFPTDAVEKLAPATARAAEPIVSLCLYLCSEEPDIAGMLPKMPARPAHPSPVRVKGGEKTFSGLTQNLGSGMAARGDFEEDQRRSEAARRKRGSGRKCRASRTRAAYSARALAHVLDGPKERRPKKSSSKMDSTDPRCLWGC